MPTLLYKDLTLVKGRQFDAWRRVEVPQSAIRVYNMRGVDELIFLDITATRAGRSPDVQLIDDLADDCFMPFSVGGGVRSLADVRRLLEVGADKVVVNSAAVEQPGLVEEVADRFGAQVLIASIDYRRADGRAEVFTHAGTRATGLEPASWARTLAGRGAGEILLTSIDRDGTMTGYDTDMIAAVAAAVPVPVIASGGAGSYAHMADALAAGASAVAAASIFHFTEQTPREAKDYLRERGFPMRVA